MKPVKWAVCGLVMALVFVCAAQPAAQAGQGVENYWPVVPGAKGDRSTGQLTIYYEVIDDVGCTTEIPNPIPGGDPIIDTEPSVKMIFLLKLYEKSGKVWHIITAVDDGPFCLTGDLANGLQQAALLNFLDYHVLPRLTASAYTQIYLKDAVDDYENTVTPPKGPPYCVSAEITIVAQ